MIKTELLAPAGDMETLFSAIHNGADAVYIGGKKFGARAYSSNFDNDEIKKAVKYAHIYNVKIYVCANTVIFEDEINEFLNYMKFLYGINVDAVIMQDIGMINLVRNLIPSLEVHASTQVNIHNNESLKLLKEIGVKRVVLARELSLNEIKNLNTNIEKEIFIHGALCVSYSGECLFSSLNGGRSGNRGRCTGSCRLPYISDKNKGYLLSTKELCTTTKIKDILDLNISCLKIEGRMKSPEYVGYVTKVYRRLIDEYYMSKDPKVTNEEMMNLAKLFNREFTLGYLFNDDIYNIKTPNHIGYPLGKIIKLGKKIHIKLTDNLYQEDGIRFNESKKGMIVNKLYSEKGLLVNHIDKGNIAVIDNKVNLKTKDTINKTIDRNLLKEINTVSPKKIHIDFKLIALKNKPLSLSVTNGIKTVKSTLDYPQIARNKPTTKEEIFTKLNKLNNTPYILNKCEIYLDDVFIPFKDINNLKHSVLDKLMEDKTNKISFSYHKQVKEKYPKELSVLVRGERQLKMYLDKARIYTEDYKLYLKYKKHNVYFKLPRIMNEFPDYQNENLLVSELGSLYKYSKSNNVIADYPLNITNSETVNFFHKLGVKISTLSPEVKDFALTEKYSYPTEKIIYGRPDLMIIKNLDNYKYLKNKFGYFPIIYDKYVTILHHKNIDLLDEKGRILLYDETTRLK